MSFMTNFRTAEDFQTFMRDQIRSLSSMTEFTYPDAASLPPRAFASHNTSTSQPLVPIVDPNLLSPSNGDCIGLDSKAASGPKPQSNSTWQVPQYHTLTHTHHMGAHNQHIPQATTSNRSILPRPHSTRSDRSGNNGQTVRPSLQSQQRRPNSDTGTQADATQGQPPRKKQRKSPASGNTLSKNATTEEAQETSEVAESDEDSGDTVDRSNYRARRVRMTNGVMKWLDEEDNRWKPAGYHRNYRAKLIALDAQQPGAPVWTPEMGTNYTSYSPLTQGWSDDPTSVLDAKGRHVFSMKKRPADWVHNPKYGPLIYSGLIMLDHNDVPVRDIPGVPLTLETQAPPWLLEGLRRSSQMTYADFRARMPATRETPTGTKNLQGATTLPQRIRRWLQEKNISQWLKRSRAKKIEQPLATKHDRQGPGAVGRKSLQPAGPQLGLDDLNSGFFNHEQCFPPGISYEPASKHDTAQSRLGAYPYVYMDPTLPSWEANTLAEFGGHADTSHLPISQSYNPKLSFKETPAYNDGGFESQTYGRCVPFGGGSFDKRDPVWNPNNQIVMAPPRTESNTHEANQNSNMSTLSRNYGQQMTASPMLRGKYQQLNQKYHLGTQSAFAQPMNVLRSNMTYSPNVTPDVPTRYIGSQKQPQSSGGQRQPASVMTNTNDILGRPGINADTQKSLFQSGDFRYVQPRTAAEIAFVRSALDYTRAEYRSWMSVEPPESSHLASYAEQYGKIQEHLEENWPFSDSLPVKLRAIGPVFGGLDQW